MPWLLETLQSMESLLCNNNPQIYVGVPCTSVVMMVLVILVGVFHVENAL